jgi:hypothetical protein
MSVFAICVICALGGISIGWGLNSAFGTKDTTITTQEPVHINCRVKGGPDHGHTFSQEFPGDSVGFMGVLRNLCRYKLIESDLRIDFEPDPLITITRTKPDFLKHAK